MDLREGPFKERIAEIRTSYRYHANQHERKYGVWSVVQNATAPEYVRSSSGITIIVATNTLRLLLSYHSASPQ